ncbi:hypothetical protein K439DRAFT_1630711 [Ramaria rubella]|nr:hypothetical protein K439DRAFT_1630711 [Ramaria rubella]
MGHSYSQPRHTLRRVEQAPDTRSLPPEVVYSILETAYCQAHTPCHERRAGLRTASLVSLRWAYLAQQLLWRCIDIKGYFRLKALRNTCDLSLRGLELASHTNKLSVWMRASNDYPWSPTMHDIARLLKRLPRVQVLHLDSPPSELPLFASFDLQIAVTRRPDVPRLTTLRVSFARPALVHNLLHILPCLRFVDIRGSLSNDAGEDEPPPNDLTPHCQLYEIRWGVLSRYHVTHALRSSSNTLRILALHSLPPAFATLMSTHGMALRSLRVFRYDPSLPDAIYYCPVLEEFIMQDHIPPPELLAALPLTLEHLAVDCDYGHQRGLKAVSAWVTQRRGRLHVLTCFSPDYCDADWPDFVRACRENKVELRCYKGWHGTYKDEDEELGEVNRFPRAVPYHEQRILRCGGPA